SFCALTSFLRRLTENAPKLLVTDDPCPRISYPLNGGLLNAAATFEAVRLNEHSFHSLDCGPGLLRCQELCAELCGYEIVLSVIALGELPGLPFSDTAAPLRHQRSADGTIRPFIGLGYTAR